MKRCLVFLALVLATAVNLACARGDVDAGKAVVTGGAVKCSQCHGDDGNAGIDPQYPRLAGQYSDYLDQALREYKTGARKNPIMAAYASQLSDVDIENVAAYYASLPGGKLTDLHDHVQGD